MTATDAQGQASEDSFQITVTEAVPTVTLPAGAAPLSTAEASTATFTLQLTDPDATDDEALYADFGSGTYEQVDPSNWTSSSMNGNVQTITVQHYYDTMPATGTTYSARFYLSDDGQTSAVCNDPITITPARPSGYLMGILPGTNNIANGGTVSLDSNSLPAVFLGANGIAEPSNMLGGGYVLQFTNVSDPSTADTANLEYHWTISGEGEKTTTINEFELKNADFNVGTVLTVQAFISVKNQPNLRSATQTIDVYKGPTGEPNGTFLPAGAAVPATYDPNASYSYVNLTGAPTALGTQQITFSQTRWPINQTLHATFTPNPATETLGPKGAASLYYKYSVTVYNVASGTWSGIRNFFVGPRSPSPTHVITSTSNSLDINLADYGAAAEDREIIVTCDPFIDMGYLDPNDGSEANLNRVAVGSYIIVLDTPKSKPLSEQISDVYNLIKRLSAVVTDGVSASQVVNAVLSGKGAFFTTLTNGLNDAFKSFTDPKHLSGVLDNAISQGLGLPNVNIPAGADLTTSLLSYAGLTVDNLKGMVVQAVGGNNAAAANLIASWFQAPSGQAPSVNDVFNNINQSITKYKLDNSLDLSYANLTTQLQNAVVSKLTTAATQATGSLVAKFVPGLGGAAAMLDGFKFLLDNQDQITAVVQDFMKSLSNLLKSDATGFASKLVTTLDNTVPVLLRFAISQLGLGNLATQLQTAANFVPTTVQQQLMKVVSAIAAKVPSVGISNNLFAGQLAPMVQVPMPGGITYDLWVAKASNQPSNSAKAVVKIANDNGGRPFLVATVTDKDFTSNQAKRNIGTLISDANALVALLAPIRPLSTSQGQATPSSKLVTQEQNLVNKIKLDETAEKTDIQNNTCTALGSCFRGHVKLETSKGWKRVDEIQVDDMVASRSEADPDGPIEFKRVEAKFERTGSLLDVTVNGQVIGTTPEHPFYEAGKGWTEASALVPGDQIRTKDGWATVEKILDAGFYEKVYNIRVADFHTYFVGDEGWGFAVWAHNLYARFGSGNTFAIYNLGTGYAFQFDKRVSITGQNTFSAPQSVAMVAGRNSSVKIQNFTTLYTLSSVNPIKFNRVGTSLTPTIAPQGSANYTSTNGLGGTWAVVDDLTAGALAEPQDNPNAPPPVTNLEKAIRNHVPGAGIAPKYLTIYTAPAEDVKRDPHTRNPGGTNARWIPAEAPGISTTHVYAIMTKVITTSLGPDEAHWLIPIA